MQKTVEKAHCLDSDGWPVVSLADEIIIVIMNDLAAVAYRRTIKSNKAWAR